ncbi:PREDICTED: uncharacterized protein LOC106338356 [Brassica oleracea var. oleracea]|uniref:uncharacterized protein LOC106338356 n=1 Tax=Brassica oleracea var. oleracea TaxID=109376 RepID=UPI0006A7222C|nr:PREDICTED: uncharacterized protein LOC106338356 [Brassica oleracea var. oleracea]
MNAKYPTFVAEERNMRLGLSTDGFNPFNMKNSMYSFWPLLLVNYNLPPDLCMKKENIMLSLLIPGPQQPGNSIDIYLEPLIEDLNHMWSSGELVYDAFTRSTFTLKTDSMWLKYRRKHVYMYHRKGLPPSHSFRGKKKWFDGKSEQRRRGRILTGLEISQNLRNFKNDFGNVKHSGSKRKKMELPVRHNLDVMHVEINVATSLVSTLLHCGKSKDGLPARKDLEDLGIRQDLHLASMENEHIFLQHRGLCLRQRRRYFTGDFLTSKGQMNIVPTYPEKLLPIALKGVLPKGPRLAISRLCAFFNLLCQRVIDREQLLVMEAEIVETLCLFERYFPPSFFDIMVHLTVHLGREARLGGPVHFRWMYPFERYMKVLKNFVRNPARPEGCIAESYLAEECMKFCSEFLKKSTNVQDKIERNMDYENSSILEGRPISGGTSVPLDSKEHDETLKWLAYGPRSSSKSYTGYIVNGQRLHTTSIDWKSQNSGVYYEATAVCRSSVKDTSQVVDWVSYYGRWAVKGNGVKIEDGFTLVNMNHS